MPATTTHPTPAQLRDFDRGRLDAAASEVVAQHLDGCEACQATLDGVPSDTFVGRLKAACPATRKLALDLPSGLADHPRYRVVGELGRGGMGIVYKAEHRVMGRTVALKVVQPEMLGDAEARARFLDEIKTAGQLEHDNVVRAYEAESLDGLYVLAMEYVDGLSLDRVLKAKGPLPVAHACNYARQAALGLQYMHERGLVHRDIKPQNLMVTRQGKVKILDVGLARKADRVGPGVTGANECLGTPDYIAPEQARDTRSADIRADVYSLGCTLYHLLSGQTPFDGDTPVSVILARMSGDAVPLGERCAGLPAGLSEVVAKMMARSVGERYQTPGEAAKALLPYCKAAAVAVGGNTLKEAVAVVETPQAAFAAFAEGSTLSRRTAVKAGRGKIGMRTAVGGGLVALVMVVAGFVIYFKWTDERGRSVELMIGAAGQDRNALAPEAKVAISRLSESESTSDTRTQCRCRIL